MRAVQQVRERNPELPPGFRVDARGVWRNAGDGKDVLVCAPLHVRARARAKDAGWGKLLEWRDHDGVERSWIAPDAVTLSGGPELRQELANRGLHIEPGNGPKGFLAEYVVRAASDARVRLVERTGWHDGAFVMPDRVIGDASEDLLYQGDVPSQYAQRGTLEGWRGDVARFCSGNSRMLLAVSTAFAAALLDVAELESGGINFVGNSSCGKTTALRVACSVYGGPEYLRRWRATANGIEGMAALHSDSLLALDELAQVAPSEAGEIAYMLANGSGKTRASRSGAVRESLSWRLLFLSSGEIGLAQHMQAGGKRARAGQEMRLVDLDADSGYGYGVFEALHGMAGGADLSAAIVEGTRRHYGVAGPQFIEAISRDRTAISESIKARTRIFLADNMPEGGSGQVNRVCQRFGLVGIAGELASERGLTGWAPGESWGAASVCFQSWLKNRGGAGDLESGAMLSQVRGFFETHGESRFTDLSAPEIRPTPNRAGYRRRVEIGGLNPGSRTEYMVLPDAFSRDLCAGYDPKAVKQALIGAGWLALDSSGKTSRPMRIPAEGKRRVYVFTDAMWGDS